MCASTTLSLSPPAAPSPWDSSDTNFICMPRALAHQSGILDNLMYGLRLAPRTPLVSRHSCSSLLRSRPAFAASRKTSSLLADQRLFRQVASEYAIKPLNLLAYIRYTFEQHWPVMKPGWLCIFCKVSDVAVCIDGDDRGEYKN